MKAVVFTFCLFGALSCYAVPAAVGRAGETTDPGVSASASMQAHLPSLTSALSSAANALPIKPPTTSGLNMLPLTHMPTLPVHPSIIEGIPSPVAIFAVDPSNMIPGIKGPRQFNPVAIASSLVRPFASSFVRPIAKWPLETAGNAYEIPLQAWDSVKNVVDATAQIPKDGINAGKEVVDGLFDSWSG